MDFESVACFFISFFYIYILFSSIFFLLYFLLNFPITKIKKVQQGLALWRQKIKMGNKMQNHCKGCKEFQVGKVRIKKVIHRRPPLTIYIYIWKSIRHIGRAWLKCLILPLKIFMQLDVLSPHIKSLIISKWNTKL